MWDNYYDKAVYEEKTDELDRTGSHKRIPPRTIDVRCVTGGTEFIVGKDDTSIKFTKEYQIPFMVNEGDLIDGRTVISAEASKDVFGNFHFCIAKVR